MAILECVLALLAGSGIFLAGMKFMSDGLEKLSGPSMKRLLGKISGNRFVGVGVGAGVTALIQSSAATTVMAIGFVNAGVMSLLQAAPIIMGANIGTTVTGLLVSLSSLDVIDVNLWMSVLAFIGIVMMFFKKDKVKNIGSILAGLGMVFVGLDLMSGSFGGADNPLKLFVTNLFSYIDFPLLLVLFGIVFTALMQSSSAMMGLVIVMASQGAITIDAALFVVIGTNVGTCVTSLIATIGTTSNAKRTGFFHLFINIIGAIVFTGFIWIFRGPLVNLLESMFALPALQVAMFHLLFNVITVFLLLPFIKYIVKLVCLIVPDKDEEANKGLLKYIDERLLRTPQIAVLQAKKEIENMAYLSRKNIELSFNEIIAQTGRFTDDINKREDQIDYINNAITKYLIKLTSLVDSRTEKTIGSYFHVVNDIERIGDHASNFIDLAMEMKANEMTFSTEANDELVLMYNKILEMFDVAYKSFDAEKVDPEQLRYLDKLEAEADQLKADLSAAHFVRLYQGNCNMELGAYFTSTIAGLERVADHLVNVGYSVMNPTGDQL